MKRLFAVLLLLAACGDSPTDAPEPPPPILLNHGYKLDVGSFEFIGTDIPYAVYREATAVDMLFSPDTANPLRGRVTGIARIIVFGPFGESCMICDLSPGFFIPVPIESEFFIAGTTLTIRRTKPPGPGVNDAWLYGVSWTIKSPDVFEVDSDIEDGNPAARSHLKMRFVR